MTGHGAPVGDALVAALEPVRRALLDDAEREAAARTATARAEAEELVDRARSAADAEIERAERRADATRRARTERAVALARTEADREVLTTRAELHRRLDAAAREAALGLRHHERYGRLLDRLEELARAQLGATGSDDQVTVERDPEPDGGVIATDGRRRVDYTLQALADRALADLAGEVAAPWN